MYKSSEYASWKSMKRRCYDLKSRTYPSYGGVGIIVCERWLQSFQNFINDMGIKPDKSYTIDRIDNSKNYSKENCKWSTKKDQARNRKTTKPIIFNGVTTYIPDWLPVLGISETHFRRLLETKDIHQIIKFYENRGKNINTERFV